MTFFIYQIPQGEYRNLAALHGTLGEKFGVTSGLEWISKAAEYTPTNEELRFGSGYIRVCPTKETPERSYWAGLKIGHTVRSFLRE